MVISLFETLPPHPFEIKLTAPDVVIKKVVSTIDCFEVFIERPHNLTARAQT
jgi:hypothetical protein